MDRTCPEEDKGDYTDTKWLTGGLEVGRGQEMTAQGPKISFGVMEML